MRKLIINSIVFFGSMSVGFTQRLLPNWGSDKSQNDGVESALILTQFNSITPKMS
ncbi:MAG: hypothetical protein V4585_00020 [Bacteroidota bacterium]|jgi:hypothetical protein